MSRTIQLAAGAVIIAAILATVVYQSTQTTVFFYTPGEIIAAPQDFRDRTVRIGALVMPGSTDWNPNAVQLSFQVSEDRVQTLPVVFSGVKPDMYREGQGVVVQGRLDERGVFQAEELLVKHSEDYSVAERHESKEKLMGSLVQ